MTSSRDSLVVHLAKHYYPSHGGVETATRDLAEAAVSAGYQVSCHASARKAKICELNGVRLVISREWGKLFSAPLAPGILATRLDQARVIHVHLPNPFAELRIWVALLNPSFYRQRCVVPFFHAFPVAQGPLGRIWFRVITSRILACSRAVLISNPRLAHCYPILRRWEKKLTVMPFAAAAIDERERMELLEPRARKRIAIAVGRLVPYKGFDTLLHAWAQLHDQGKLSNFHLKILGDGPERARLESQVKAAGLEEQVEFCGPVSDEVKWVALRNASVFLAPSRTRAETFGISVLEAMSVALPVITTTLDTGLATLARNGECGATVQPDNSQALAHAMAKAFADPTSWLEGYGKANLDYVRDHHSRESTRARYLAILGQWIGSASNVK